MQKSGIFTKIKTAIINGGLDSAQLLLLLFYISWLFLSTHNCVWGKKHPANAGCFTLLVQSRLILFVHRVLTWIPMFRDRQQFP